MDDGIRHLEQLQQRRGRRRRDDSIVRFVTGIADDANRAQRAHGRLIDLWQALVPAHLAEQTSITGLRGGIVHVEVDSSAVSFELDRMLREGMLDALRRGFPGTIVRVRFRVVRPHASRRPSRRV